jgi:CubicO group peptidase (beta-lactamase class C family)
MITATSPPAARRRSTRTAVLVAGCALCALLLGLLTRPVAGPLPNTVTGDEQLAATARQVVGEYRPALAVACVTADTSRVATIGGNPDSRFEIGSLSKGLTGLLFADMIKRGEVQPDQRLGTLLDVHGPLADVTLAQLATHHSGLPAQPTTLAQALHGYWAVITAGNPYGQSTEELINAAERTQLSAQPGTYSTLGFEVLGAALSAAAHQPYPELITERVLAPLGMSDTTVPTTVGQLTDRDLRGETAGGRRAAPWTGEDLAPAGGVRSDIGDMAIIAQALLDGTAPGMDALEPRQDLGDSRVGWAWITTRDPDSGRTVVWHNGATGGFNSFLGIDRATGTAVVVLSAVGDSPNSITDAGFALLDQLKGCRE